MKDFKSIIKIDGKVSLKDLFEYMNTLHLHSFAIIGQEMFPEGKTPDEACKITCVSNIPDSKELKFLLQEFINQPIL